MKTKTFKSGNSEAVRIPAEMAYGPNTELEITRSGDVIVLQPAKAAHALREAVALLRSMPTPETVELLDRTESRDTLDDL
jgi:antitoxin VapB